MFNFVAAKSFATILYTNTSILLLQVSDSTMKTDFFHERETIVHEL